jgi:Na+-translocating ferredoxin:NAD+ oxidoreductase subunit B
MNATFYQKLAEHLNRLPGGFPPSKTGADLRLLEQLFTPKEAELAVQLTLERESAEVIGARLGLPVPEATRVLDEMAKKGLIFSVQTPDGGMLYQAAPLVVGIYELQINRLDQQLLNAFHEYWSSAEDSPPVKTIPQMRIIPVGESIDPQLQALPYEQVYAFVNSHHTFAVTNCICRHTAKMGGGGCQAPEESCLVFGEWAENYIRNGRGRAIDRTEVLDILAKADAANLILRPSNSQTVEFVCTCCVCCCGGLVGLKNHPRPADRVTSPFYAQLDTQKCQGCWSCLERCQMGALVEGDGCATLKPERCIGCGLCVTTCPNHALTLLRKPDAQLTQTPATLQDTWQIIARDQARASL